MLLYFWSVLSRFQQYQKQLAETPTAFRCVISQYEKEINISSYSVLVHLVTFSSSCLPSLSLYVLLLITLISQLSLTHTSHTSLLTVHTHTCTQFSVSELASLLNVVRMNSALTTITVCKGVNNCLKHDFNVV